MSITWATFWNSTSGSPLTNITRSARVLKMSVSRCCRLSQETSSWLIFSFGFSPAAPRTCTTTVRSVSVLGWFGGGGCGTSASSPLGVSGVMTMKIIRSTRRTSMSGVTLISAVWPPPPVVIAIRLFPSAVLRLRFVGVLFVFLFGQQPQLIDAGGANIVHHIHHGLVVGPRIGTHIHGLIGAVLHALFDLIRQLFRRDHLRVKEDFSVSLYCDDQ